MHIYLIFTVKTGWENILGNFSTDCMGEAPISPSPPLNFSFLLHGLVQLLECRRLCCLHMVVRWLSKTNDDNKFLVSRACWFPWCKIPAKPVSSCWCDVTQLQVGTEALTAGISWFPVYLLVLALHYDIEFNYFPGFPRFFIAGPTFSANFAAQSFQVLTVPRSQDYLLLLLFFML